MILVRTPFRISLFGGGTDMPAWFNLYGGAVISFSIDKYCHVSIREMPKYSEHKYRAVYSKIETTNNVNNIEHPVIRESIKKYGFLNDRRIEIHHHGDLPSQSGIGSSSAFAVSVIHGLNQLNQIQLNKRDLALMAIDLEQNILCENVGSQDQIACTYGGLNKIVFANSNLWEVQPIKLSEEKFIEIESRCYLVYTGIPRMSSDITKSLLENLDSNNINLNKTFNLVQQAEKLILEGSNLDYLGELLNESSRLKFQANPKAGTAPVIEFLENGIAAGALGGKILGAGGGGFCLFWLKKK